MHQLLKNTKSVTTVVAIGHIENRKGESIRLIFQLGGQPHAPPYKPIIGPTGNSNEIHRAGLLKLTVCPVELSRTSKETAAWRLEKNSECAGQNTAFPTMTTSCHLIRFILWKMDAIEHKKSPTRKPGFLIFSMGGDETQSHHH